MEIKNTSAVLIMDKDLKTEVCLPKQNDNDCVLENGLYLYLVDSMFVKKDSEFMELLKRKGAEYLPTINKN